MKPSPKRGINPSEHQQIRTGFAVRKGLEVVQHEELAALDVSGGLRHGTDISVTIGDRAVHLLSVHLKSGCFDRRLNSSADACVKLNGQVPVIEGWIDARAAGGEPFIVMGDWNRRFDAPADTFWPEIDDGEPAGADLTRVTEGRTSACWGGEFPLYIDHIVLGAQAAGWLIAASFEQVLFEEDIALQDVLSDHCALAVKLDVPGERAVGRREELLERIGAIEAELEALRRIVEGLE